MPDEKDNADLGLGERPPEAKSQFELILDRLDAIMDRAREIAKKSKPIARILLGIALKALTIISEHAKTSDQDKKDFALAINIVTLALDALK